MRPLRVIASAVLGVLGICGLASGLALVTDLSGARLRLTVDRSRPGRWVIHGARRLR